MSNLLQLSEPVPWNSMSVRQSQPDCPLCPMNDVKNTSVHRGELRYDWVVNRAYDNKVCEPVCAFTASGSYSCIPGKAPEARKCSSSK